VTYVWPGSLNAKSAAHLVSHTFENGQKLPASDAVTKAEIKSELEVKAEKKPKPDG
jgi:hypothetical protein